MPSDSPPDPNDNRRLAYRLEPDSEAEASPLVYVRVVNSEDEPVICELVDVSADGIALIWPSHVAALDDSAQNIHLTIHIPEMPPAIRFLGKIRYRIPNDTRGIRLGVAFHDNDEGDFEEEQTRLVQYVMHRQRQQIRTIRAREEE